MRTFSISLILLLSLTSNSFSLRVEEKLPLKQEKRAINLFLKVRCLVCNGQVIENSDAEFAYEMRKLIRKKISQGQNNEEIRSYLINNFGEEIITDLDSKNENYILFLSPLIFALILGFILIRQRK